VPSDKDHNTAVRRAGLFPHGTSGTNNPLSAASVLNGGLAVDDATSKPLI
jgi:hypothetical protein